MTTIRAFEVDDLSEVVDLSLRAWAPVFTSLRGQLGDPIFFRLHPDLGGRAGRSGQIHLHQAYLRRFPIDKLKIDRSFITDVTDNPNDAVIALAIIQLGHSLNLKVIAEGVETASQLAYLRAHKCDQIQGYYFSRPLPVPDLEQLLLAGTRLQAPKVQHSI